MKSLLVRNDWIAFNIIVMVSVCLSLVLHFIIGVALVYMAKEAEFIDEHKRNELIKKNNVVTLLALIISFINIFLNMFLVV